MRLRAAMLAGVVGAAFAQAAWSDCVTDPFQHDPTPEDVLVKRLRPVLSAQGKAARIAYEGRCVGEGYYQIVMPAVKMQEPRPGATGVDAIASMFEGSPNVAVSEYPQGVIRVNIGSPSLWMFETKIAFVNFSPVQQFTPKLALMRISNTAEVRAAMHGLTQEGGALSIIPGREPNSGEGHIAASMANVSFDEALDALASTFGGIVIYEVCSDRLRYGLYFRDGQDLPQPPAPRPAAGR